MNYEIISSAILNLHVMLMKKFLVLFIFLANFLQISGQIREIPEFTFKKMENGTDFSRKNIPGGRKSLFIFFDTECPHCMRAMSEFNDNQKQLAKSNVLLVTRDRKELVMPFINNFGADLYGKKNVTLLSDVYNHFIARFLPKKFPSIFLFAENGKLLHYTDEEKDIPVIMKKIIN
jgi:peroxiredoxin